MLSVAVNQAILALHEARLLSAQKQAAVGLDHRVALRTQELAVEQLRLQASLLQHIPVAAWTLTPDGVPDIVSQSWFDYTGQTAEYVKSNPEAWMTTLHPEDRESAIKSFWHGIRSRRGFTMEARFFRIADQTYRWHLNRAVPLRPVQPRTLVEGEWLVGYGCATACYPSNCGPAAVRVSLTAEGKAAAALAGHEIGTGAYTTVAIAVAYFLGLDVKDVAVKMGDSDLPPVMIAGGSNNAASTTNVIAKACEEIRSRIAVAAVRAADSPFHGADPATLRLVNRQLTDGAARVEAISVAAARTGQRLEVYVENIPEGLPRTAVADMSQGKPVMLGGSARKDATAFAFGAHFVEVRVHQRTRELRVARVVSAFAAGTIINAKAAHSQFMSGSIWGLSSALLEETELDVAAARFVNTNLADYLVPVNADIPSIEVILVPESDTTVNPLGVKGIGEIGIVGMNAAVANAVFNATGTRIRDLPIRAEKLL